MSLVRMWPKQNVCKGMYVFFKQRARFLWMGLMPNYTGLKGVFLIKISIKTVGDGFF